MTEVTFGEWLKRQRGAQGWTQRQLAQKLNCSFSTLRKLEAEERHPSTQVVEQLIEIFHIPQNEQKAFQRFARGDWGAFSRGESESFPWYTSRVATRTNLPASITSFIGREKEQTEIIQLLSKHRLITLTGSGGVGKTRLSLKVGEQLQGNYPDGIWLVELAALTNPDLLAQTIASVFEINSTSTTPLAEILINVLRAKTTLLILDNCEHLLDACAQLADTLLKNCPNLKILATSREPLGIIGEAIYRIPSLGLPDLQQVLDTFRDFESVRLFEVRAKLAQFDFALTVENASAVAQICHRLDGIPLALELAAAKVETFSAEQIAKQLDESFNLLTGGSRTALPRQQTLRASIDWSWNLLTESEQTMMRQLAVFSGGWTLDAALAICDGDVMGLTSTLVRKSLIVMNQEGRRETRYGFHEVVRQYACEKLNEINAVETLSQRFAAYFVALAEEAESKLFGPDEIEWLDWLEIENPNLRAVLEWSINNNPEIGLRLAGALYYFWGVRGYWHEANTWLERLLAIPREASHSEIRVKALNAAGFLAWCISDAKSSRSLYLESLAISREIGNRREEANALHGLGRAARLQSDYQTAHQFYEEGLSIWREVDDKVGIADTLLSIGALAYRQGNLDEAHLLLEESLILSQELENLSGIAPTFYFLGRVSAAQGNYENATFLYNKTLDLFQKLADKAGWIYTLETMGRTAHIQADYATAWEKYQESLHLSRKAGHNVYTAAVLADLGHLAMIDNNYTEAHTLYTESLMLFKQTGEKQAIINCLVGWANLAQIKGQTEQATKVCGAIEALLQTTMGHLVHPEQDIYRRTVANLRAQLNELTFIQKWAEGQTITLDEAIILALTDTSSP